MKNETTEETQPTPAKVAEILQVIRATAYTRLQDGEIPTVRIGSLYGSGAGTWSGTSGERQNQEN